MTWGREEFYRKLQKQNIYFLRVYGRKVGVSRPTSKRKGQLIDEIVKILTGEKPPSKRSVRGAPPKSADLEEVLSGIAVRKNAVAVLKLIKREFTLLVELVCMGNIIAQANEEEEKMRRCRELTYKICRQCSLFLNATQRKAQGGKCIRSDP